MANEGNRLNGPDHPRRVENSSEDAAVALARAPLFAALTPLDRAKLSAILEDRWIPAGEVVFEAGGHADALYVLRTGTAERRVAGSVIGTIEPPELFGELALLTNEPRSASVIARTPLRVWALPRARFQPLLRQEPELLFRLSAAVSRSLAETRRQLGQLQRELDGWVSDRLAELPDADRELVTGVAALDKPDPKLLARLTHSAPGTVEARLAAVAEKSPLLAREDGSYYPPPAIREALVRVLDGGGEGSLAARRRQAAKVLECAGDAPRALVSYVEAGDTDDAVRVYQALPLSARRAMLADQRLPPGWADRLGVSPEPPDLEHPPSKAPESLRGQLGRPGARAIGALGAGVLLLVLWWVAPAGLSPEGWRALVVLLAGAILLAFDVLPDAVVALMIVAGWVVPGLLDPRLALAGFATPSWLLVLSVLAVGVAVGNTGLLYRAALAVLTRAPAGFGWRMVLLALFGTLVTPTLPNATSRVALAAPLVRELAEALGYRPGGRGATGLGLAALVGFGQMSGLFLTGSSVGLLVHGLLPPESRARFDFGSWFLASLPLHLVLAALALAAIALWYRPRQAASGGVERLVLQRAVLGAAGREEWLSAAVLTVLVVGFLTEPLHRVNGAWFGVMAVVLLVAGGALDATMLRTGVNWNFLIFFGVITSLGGVFSTLGIDHWLADMLQAPTSALAAAPAFFCIGLALAGFALSLVIRWQAAAPLLTLVATPAASAVGIEPFLVALISLVATQVWFFPFQSTVYLALYHGSGELFSHRDARLLAWAWGPMVLVSLVAAVPVWRWIGLLP